MVISPVVRFYVERSDPGFQKFTISVRIEPDRVRFSVGHGGIGFADPGESFSMGVLL
jgi:hypothetical protein